METLIQLKELPFKEFTLFERFQNFTNMLDILRFIMVLMVSFSIILMIGFTIFWLFNFKHDAKNIGRVIVINSVLLSVAVWNISTEYLPMNNYELYIYDYQVNDKIYENIENPHAKYLYRDGYRKINGYKTELIDDTTEMFIYKN